MAVEDGVEALGCGETGQLPVPVTKVSTTAAEDVEMLEDEGVVVIPVAAHPPTSPSEQQPVARRRLGRLTRVDITAKTPMVVEAAPAEVEHSLTEDGALQKNAHSKRKANWNVDSQDDDQVSEKEDEGEVGEGQRVPRLTTSPQAKAAGDSAAAEGYWDEDDEYAQMLATGSAAFGKVGKKTGGEEEEEELEVVGAGSEGEEEEALSQDEEGGREGREQRDPGARERIGGATALQPEAPPLTGLLDRIRARKQLLCARAAAPPQAPPPAPASAPIDFASALARVKAQRGSAGAAAGAPPFQAAQPTAQPESVQGEVGAVGTAAAGVEAAQEGQQDLLMGGEKAAAAAGAQAEGPVVKEQGGLGAGGGPAEEEDEELVIEGGGPEAMGTSQDMQGALQPGGAMELDPGLLLASTQDIQLALGQDVSDHNTLKHVAMVDQAAAARQLPASRSSRLKRMAAAAGPRAPPALTGPASHAGQEWQAEAAGQKLGCGEGKEGEVEEEDGEEEEGEEEEGEEEEEEGEECSGSGSGAEGSGSDDDDDEEEEDEAGQGAPEEDACEPELLAHEEEEEEREAGDAPQASPAKHPAGDAGKLKAKKKKKRGQPRFVELEAELSDEDGEGSSDDEDDEEGQDGMLAGLVGTVEEGAHDEVRRAKLHKRWQEEQDEDELRKIMDGVRNGFRRPGAKGMQGMGDMEGTDTEARRRRAQLFGGSEANEADALMLVDPRLAGDLGITLDADDEAVQGSVEDVRSPDHALDAHKLQKKLRAAGVVDEVVSELAAITHDTSQEVLALIHTTARPAAQGTAVPGGVAVAGSGAGAVAGTKLRPSLAAAAAFTSARVGGVGTAGGQATAQQGQGAGQGAGVVVRGSFLGRNSAGNGSHRTTGNQLASRSFVFGSTEAGNSNSAFPVGGDIGSAQAGKGSGKQAADNTSFVGVTGRIAASGFKQAQRKPNAPSLFSLLKKS